MDLLKTLLVYMIMTTAGATLDMGATPIPYAQLHTPTPVVTATPSPTPTPEPTATPAPTPSLATLNVGSRGTNVRNMQKKLIELGYLSGEPDGIYGNQTRDAVKLFQQRNGLEDDGIAGRQTLNKLYNDPAVVPAPGVATAVPVTPTAAPVSAQVTVNYQLADGQLLASENIVCYAGNSSVWGNLELLPMGYRLTADESQTVSVSPDGAAAPAVLTFLCEPVMGDVTVLYQAQTGETLHSETLSFLAGTHTLSADDALVPAGYTLLSQRLVAFAVNEQGLCSPEAIVFTYQAPAPTAEPTAVPTTEPTAVPTTVPTAEPTVEPTAVPTAVPTAEPTAEPTAVPTAVPTAEPTAEPTAAPTAVPTAEPTAEPTAKPTATAGVIIEITSELPVEYRAGDSVIVETVIPMPREDTLVYPDASIIPEGYELKSMNALSLDADKLPDVVVFELQEVFFLCQVEIIYETLDGQLLASERRQVSSIERSITPNHTLIGAQYALVSASPVEVPLEQLLSASPNHIVFRYEQVLLTKSQACVTVDGKQLSIPFHVDEKHRLYLPVKALSSALLLSCSTDGGFTCEWNGHALNIRCENDVLVNAEVDEKAVSMSETVLMICQDNEIYATVPFFTHLGYEVSQNQESLLSVR